MEIKKFLYEITFFYIFVKKENRSILKLGKNIKDELTNNYRLDTAESVINNEKREDLENIFMHLHPDYKLFR